MKGLRKVTLTLFDVPYLALFRAWQRSITVTAGRAVNLEAVLERVP